MEQKTQAKMLRDQLENATGKPEHVVAVNLDVRGFSSFCERNESASVVTYISEVYKRLIDRYFRQIEECPISHIQTDMSVRIWG